jgi:methyl-accepting chemotaxis protein
MRLLSDLTVRSKMIAAALVLGFGILGLVLISTNANQRTQIHSPLYRDLVDTKDIVADALPPPYFLIEARQVMLEMVVRTDPAVSRALESQFAQLKRDFETRGAYWAAKPGDDERKRHIEATQRTGQDFIVLFERRFLPLVMKGDFAQAKELSAGEANEVFLRHRASVDALVANEQRIATAIERKAQDDIVEARRTELATAGALFVLLIVVGVLLSRTVVTPLVEMRAAASRMAEGDLAVVVAHRSGDELGALADAFRSLIDQSKGLAQAAARISNGDVSTDVVARSDEDVLAKSMQQINISLRAVLSESEAVIRDVSAGKLDVAVSSKNAKGAYQELLVGLAAVARSVRSPIDAVQSALSSVSRGDLTVRVHGEYQGAFASMQNSFNSALASLHDSFGQVSATADQVTSSASQIAASSQSVAQGATEQARSLEETSSSLEEMSSMTKQNAESAKSAQMNATDAKSASDVGSGAVVQMTGAMEKIRAAAEGTAAIIRDINDIAFQTNLLALNAAVEAARAGDAGRGFAVVAEEVRSLALRSKEAAKKTEALIHQSVQLAHEGGTVAARVTENLGSIVSSVSRVSTLISSIATASEEQARGVEQVNRAVSQMDQVTQQNAANAEQSSSAAQELSSQARRLADLVGRFKVDKREAAQAPFAPLNQTRPRPKEEHTAGISASSLKSGFVPLDDDPVFRQF